MEEACYLHPVEKALNKVTGVVVLNKVMVVACNHEMTMVDEGKEKVKLSLAYSVSLMAAGSCSPVTEKQLESSLHES